MKRSLWSIGFGVLLITLIIKCSSTASESANGSSDVSYTGIESCKSCHKRIYNSFVETGMGQSLYRPDKERIIEQFGPDQFVYDESLNFYYQPFWKQDSFYIKEFRLLGNDTVHQRLERIDYVIGSGHQTRSYLLDRNGYLFEAPITWYVSRQIWDLSPGYEDKNTRFSREIGEECLACHTGYIEPVENSNNRFRKVSLGIDCEKCHGPGQAHIQTMRGEQRTDDGEEIAYKIVNPASLPLKEQFDICQQCHLQGVKVMTEGKSVLDFRPGMRLKDVHQTFIEKRKDDNAYGIASHAERLQQSRCFIQSKGKLNCTSCHNPHKSINQTKVELYIRRCQSCHKKEQVPHCAESEELKAVEAGNCISCHMPAGGTSDIPHVRFHDHKIRVVQTPIGTNLADTQDYLELICATDSTPSPVEQGKAWLQYFERFERNPVYLENASKYISDKNPYEKALLLHYQGKQGAAWDLLEKTPTSTDMEIEYLYLKGEILTAQNKHQEAWTYFQQAYQLSPEHISLGIKYGVSRFKAEAGNKESLVQVKQLFSTLLELNPRNKQLLSNIGFVNMQLGNIVDASSSLSEALALDPDYAQALLNMIQLQMAKGDLVEARAYFKQLLEKYPDHPSKNLLQQHLGG